MSDWSTPARQELLRRARERRARLGRRGLRRRPPRPRRPERQIRAYQSQFRAIVRDMEAGIREWVFPELTSLLAEAGTRADGVRNDDWSSRLDALFIATRTSVAPTEAETKRVADSLGDEIVEVATDEQVRQVRVVLGVAPDFYNEQQVGDLLNAWKRHNNAFITKFTDEQLANAQDAVSRGVRSGRSTKDIQADLKKQFSISNNRAELIARTETSQLNTQISRSRQRDLGIDGYTWRTVGDERVRDQHDALNGRHVAWDSPPAETGGQHAGEPPNCRCTPESDVQGLLDELEAA